MDVSGKTTNQLEDRDHNKFKTEVQISKDCYSGEWQFLWILKELVCTNGAESEWREVAHDWSQSVGDAVDDANRFYETFCVEK